MLFLFKGEKHRKQCWIARFLRTIRSFRANLQPASYEEKRGNFILSKNRADQTWSNIFFSFKKFQLEFQRNLKRWYEDNFLNLSFFFISDAKKHFFGDSEHTVGFNDIPKFPKIVPKKYSSITKFTNIPKFPKIVQKKYSKITKATRPISFPIIYEITSKPERVTFPKENRVISFSHFHL